MNKIKVLHLIRSLKKAGAEKICIDICTELNKRKDIQVLLVSMSSENAFEKLTKNIPFKIINSKVFPSITGKSNIETKEYEVILDDFKPDIVSMAKGIATGLPLAAVATRREIAEVINFNYFNTVGGGNVQIQAGMETLKIIKREKLA